LEKATKHSLKPSSSLRKSNALFKLFYFTQFQISIKLWASRLKVIKLNEVTVKQLLACLHDQNKMAFLEGRLFSSQSDVFENFTNHSDWLDKSRPSKKSTFVLIM